MIAIYKNQVLQNVFVALILQQNIKPVIQGKIGFSNIDPSKMIYIHITFIL